MQIITDRDLHSIQPFRHSIALGNFDGVHRGHQKIIQRAIGLAKKRGNRSLIFTFHPHPLQVLQGENAPRLISTLAQRNAIIRSLKPDLLFIKEFHTEFAQMGHQHFVEKYLHKIFQARDIIVGKDFSFGCGGKGSVETLQRLAKKFRFQVTALDMVRIQGQRVKSTLIRELIATGKMEEVEQFLGRPFTLSGLVIKGQGRGKMLGFPTANLHPFPHMMIPPEGVYVVQVLLGKKTYPGVANIGFCPTFSQENFSIEIHLMDFSGDLYQKQLEVTFFRRIRDEIAFSSQKKLKEQVQLDMRFAREYLAHLFPDGLHMKKEYP